MQIDDNIKDLMGILAYYIVGPILLKWIEGQLWLRFVDYDYYFEYMDNVRFAAKSDQAACDDYMSRKKKGCCGFQDFVLKHPDGEEYMIGFNYGH